MGVILPRVRGRLIVVAVASIPVLLWVPVGISLLVVTFANIRLVSPVVAFLTFLRLGLARLTEAFAVIGIRLDLVESAFPGHIVVEFVEVFGVGDLSSWL